MGQTCSRRVRYGGKRTRDDTADPDPPPPPPPQPAVDQPAAVAQPCAVCCAQLAGAPTTIALPCGHALHDECWRGWQAARHADGVDATCPMCRRPVTAPPSDPDRPPERSGPTPYELVRARVLDELMGADLALDGADLMPARDHFVDPAEREARRAVRGALALLDLTYETDYELLESLAHRAIEPRTAATRLVARVLATSDAPELANGPNRVARLEPRERARLADAVLDSRRPDFSPVFRSRATSARAAAVVGAYPIGRVLTAALQAHRPIGPREHALTSAPPALAAAAALPEELRPEELRPERLDFADVPRALSEDVRRAVWCLLRWADTAEMPPSHLVAFIRVPEELAVLLLRATLLQDGTQAAERLDQMVARLPADQRRVLGDSILRGEGVAPLHLQNAPEAVDRLTAEVVLETQRVLERAAVP